jgi:hypothetical protein
MHVSHSFWVLLGYIVSKEGKLQDLKKNPAIVHMPKDIQVFNAMAQYYKCFYYLNFVIGDLIGDLIG